MSLYSGLSLTRANISTARKPGTRVVYGESISGPAPGRRDGAGRIPAGRDGHERDAGAVDLDFGVKSEARRVEVHAEPVAVPVGDARRLGIDGDLRRLFEQVLQSAGDVCLVGV